MKVRDIKEDDIALLAKGLHKVSFFSSFIKSDFEKIAQSFTVQDYDAGEIVFNAGEKGKSFFIVRDGSVDVVKKKFGIISSVVASLGKLQFFGEMALVEKNNQRTATIKAGASKASVFCLKCQDFSSLFSDNPSFRRALKAISDSRK
ncbi:cyclic nucleotide-binding domain-containing protein [bacterium]|jgi:CRP/FNR family transcriptional regulator, cyclic AMP receptor protein|nr:cyclic nucleotide-binding domain-containing protein [bacterium]